MKDAGPEMMSLFHGALERSSAEERAAYLDVACGQDAELRERIEALLRAHEQAGGFLPEGSQQPSDPRATADERSTTEQAGLVLAGRYKLVEQIGEGGMGTVWMTQQTEPIKRLVAVKLLKPGMDSRQVVARFEAERQALALMDHPNIAKVLDGGTTGAGRPYFVMDLVRGVPITRYCDEHRLTPRQRLELFVPVCQAVQHAHQKGIIHRDIKPSNVLVAFYDGRPVPKVIDFGVAKAAGQPLTEHTLVTGFGAVVGTPEYMSPEQAELNNQDIDTRSDVYSLGVLLYELLTGTTPVDRKRLRKVALLEVLRKVREEEPPRPSARVSTTEELPAIAANRATEPKRLSGLVRGELDWIVMKALEKDRNQRYETANGFALDVQRYLADEPVLACPPSAWYRFRKFARRNKARLTIAAGLLTAVAVLAGGCVWTWQDKAKRQAKTTYEVNEALREATLLWDQAKAAPVGDLSKWNAALEAAKRARTALDAGSADDEIHQRVQRTLAELEEGRTAARLAAVQAGRDRRMVERLVRIRLQANVGDGYLTLGQADRDYATAFREYGIDLLAMSPADAAAAIRKRAIQADLVAALHDWLHIRLSARKPDSEGVSRLLQALGAADPDPLRAGLRDALTRKDATALEKLAAEPETLAWPTPTLQLLGYAIYDLGNLAAAVSLLRKVRDRHPDDFWINFSLAAFLQKADPSSMDEAIACCMSALSQRGDMPAVWLAFGGALARKGDPDQALAAWRVATRLEPRFAAAYSNIGAALLAKGADHQTVAAYYRKAIALEPDFAAAHYNLGNLLAAKGSYDDAIAEYRETIRLEPKFATAYNNLGNALSRKGAVNEALEAYRKAIQLQPDLVKAHINLGLTLKEQGQFGEALDALKRGAEFGSKNPQWPDRSKVEKWIRDCERLVELDKRLAAALQGQAKPAEAAGWLELVQVCKLKRQPRAAVRVYELAFTAHPELAADFRAGRRFDAACAAAVVGCAGLKDAGPPDEKERLHWRRQALTWLRADLALCTKQLKGADVPFRAMVRQRLERWQREPDLAGLREAAALSRLSPSEQEAWAALWADVERLLASSVRP
jgi:serine/threonine protein kinase/tetratricopeptide (TPR) repeat protein